MRKNSSTELQPGANERGAGTKKYKTKTGGEERMDEKLEMRGGE